MHAPLADPSAASSDPCGICGGRGKRFRFKYGYPILLCQSCGNAFVPRSLIPANLEEIYSKGYFEGEQETGYPGYLADAPLITKNFEDRLRSLESLPVKGRRLLDVGAAYGLFLGAAKSRGWNASGVEIAPDCALEASRISGAEVLCGDFATMPLSGAFDVIVMLDVIEHLRDPVASLRRAHELLSPGGYLVVDTGDIETPWARVFGNRWHFLDPPQHLFYFSARGLRTALATAGFRGEIRLTRPGRRVSITNIAHKLAAGAPGGALKSMLARLARMSVPLALYLNFGDGMVVAARRD